MNRFNFTKKQLVVAGIIIVVFVIIAVFTGISRSKQEAIREKNATTDSEKIIALLKNDGATTAMELRPQFVGNIKHDGQWYIASVNFSSASTNSISYNVILLKGASGNFSIAAGLGDSFDADTLAKKGIPKNMIDTVVPATSSREIDE